MIEKLTQIKENFSEEALALTSNLQNKISELDTSLPISNEQLDDLASTHKLLKDSAIKANFLVPKSPFAEIIDHFDESIQLLRDRQCYVDWIIKGLFFEAISMMEQIINEYCLEKVVNPDWIELQNNLFDQITEHLILNANNLEVSNTKDKDNEPFNLENTPEALHLFDIDFQIESDDQLYPNELNQLNDPVGFLLIQLDEEEQSVDSLELDRALPENSNQESPPLLPSPLSKDLVDDVDENSDSTVDVISEVKLPIPLPMPELLADIFPVESTDKLLGNDDETELLGVSWEDEDGDDDPWTKFSSIESWTAMDDNEVLILEKIKASFELPRDRNGADDSMSNNLFDPLDEDEDMFWNSLESMQNLNLPTSLVEKPLLTNQMDVDSNSAISEVVEEMEFSTDVDTEIEESPIYQNNISESLVFEEDRPLTNLDFKEIPNVDANLDLNTEINLATPSNDATIRIPLNYLEMLGDLSEELLVRKGSLDIYSREMRLLVEDAQKNLQLLDSNAASHDSSHNPTAIANLQSVLKGITNVLDRAEHQTYEMGQDVRNLRKNFRQVLKHPISSLVRKFPRILRDLSLQHGKQVELIVQGAEVSIERILSEIIVEPLEQILRNAFEYGIESPSERQKLGKSAQGKIEIVAAQTDESTVIKISDDGCGIDNNVDLSDVRRKLIEIGGTLSKHAQIGKGTEFTFILPNTLSLIRVLMIDINEMCLAIPSKNILEVISMDSFATSHGDMEDLMWRDRKIPVARLNSLLKLNCRHNLSQTFSQTNQSLRLASQFERQKPSNAVPSFLVIHHENDLFALQTDGCWHDQEATFHQIEGDVVLPQIFLGTVILGNNQAIALLSLSELVSQCLPSQLNAVASIAQTSNKNLDNLNSLSAFFGGGESSLESDLSGALEHPVRTLARSPEPENLESSGVFVGNLVNSQAKRHHQSRVLIVESSANVRRYLAMTLSKSGFLTEQVQDGKEAIAFLKESLKNKLNIDIVITDLEMPQMDGFKLLSDIRADEVLHNLPIVVLTSRNNENDQKLALDLGANAYFSKPYREQELVAKIQQLTSS